MDSVDIHLQALSSALTDLNQQAKRWSRRANTDMGTTPRADFERWARDLDVWLAQLLPLRPALVGRGYLIPTADWPLHGTGAEKLGFLADWYRVLPGITAHLRYECGQSPTGRHVSALGLKNNAVQ